MTIDPYLMAPIVAGQDLISVQERWSIDDLADWHEAVDIKAEAQEYHLKRARENAGK